MPQDAWPVLDHADGEQLHALILCDMVDVRIEPEVAIAVQMRGIEAAVPVNPDGGERAQRIVVRTVIARAERGWRRRACRDRACRDVLSSRLGSLQLAQPAHTQARRAHAAAPSAAVDDEAGGGQVDGKKADRNL